MFLTRMAIPRRTFLRGLGTTIALPMLDAMVPALTAAPAALSPAPRVSFIYIANGVIQDQWTPKSTGAGFELTPILKPLEPVRNHINVISGLAHLQADTFGDGTGDHPRASAAWLTGVHAYDRTQPGIEVKLGDVGRPVDRARDRQEHAGVVARTLRRLPDGGRLRLRRLLLREHRLVAQRDDAESGRDAPARRVRAAVRGRRHRGRAARAHPQDRQHSRFGRRRKSAGSRARSAWAIAASSTNISSRCATSNSAFRTRNGRAHRRSSCRSGQWMCPRHSTSTRS